MFVSSEGGKSLVSDTSHVRCLQTPTASFTCVNGGTQTSEGVCCLVLNDFEFCHSTSGGAGGLRRALLL